MGKVVWNQYQKYAVPKIENSVRDLEDAIPFISTFTPSDAKTQKEIIQLIITPLAQLKTLIEAEHDVEFIQFKNASLAFFNVLEKIELELEKASNQSDSTRAIFHHMTQNRKNPAFGKHLK